MLLTRSAFCLLFTAACSDGEPITPVDGGGNGASGGIGGAAGSGGVPADSGAGDLEVLPTMYVSPELPVELLEDGDPIELWRAPQGGHVLLVGVRVKGLDTNFIEQKVRARIPDTGEIIAEETRTAVMEVVPEDPAFKQNDRRSMSQVVHVPVCPDYDERDVVLAEHRLEVEVTELYGDFSRGRGEVRVIPTCMQTHPGELAQCQCECAANYVLGKCGAPTRTVDGGTSD